LIIEIAIVNVSGTDDIMMKWKQMAPKKPFPLIPILAGVSVLAILLLAGGYTYASAQEQQDSFCVSCHTEPETTFFQRSVGAAPVDLASAHTGKNVRCIDCHDGDGAFGHIQAVALGARNSLLFYAGAAVQPARQTIPIPDGACLKCHLSEVLRLERNNHQHTLLARWQSSDPRAGGCVSCHSSHTTDGPALHGFLNPARSQAVCDACHQVLRDAKSAGS
jgi:hypothetical protein